MIIERNGRRFWIADDAVALGPDGKWTSITHADLTPEGLHLARQRAGDLLARTVMPTDAELLDYGRMTHPGVHEAQRAADELVEVEAGIATLEAAWAAELAALGV